MTTTPPDTAAYRLADLDQGDTLADVLDEMRAAFTRYVSLPSPAAADALVLWCAATHAQSVADVAPRLVIKAPEKRCGKSRCLDIVEALSCNALVAVNATPAAIFRSIDSDDPPTLLFDEADTLFGTKKAAEGNEDLRGLINAGHQRNRPALRVVGQNANLRAEEFPTFAMAALAGIGSMPDTIEDRAVVITMRRRLPGEHVERYRYRRDQLPLYALRDRAHDVIRSHLDELADAEPDMPVEDRAADTWEPLVAMADAAGCDWPQRARDAATAFTGAHEGEAPSPKARMLADCRAVFAAHGHPDALRSELLVEALKEDPEAPWREWGRNGLTTRALADMLRHYGIMSGNVRFPDGTQGKGYLRAKFTDAWQRYCSDEGEPSHASPTSSQPGRMSAPGRLEASPGPNRPAMTSTDEGGTDGTASPEERPTKPCPTCGEHSYHAHRHGHCFECSRKRSAA
ncbi:DUF3631 domain-containing protein [Nocardiopsis rhodophaea]|uniref:DUF3631 domain-containing protein n=1 Tax=Nocardiopsis rhodophaea TaxID=280238 RepID=A0ABP5ESZ5_9ACTN